AGDRMPEPLRARFLTELYRHGRFLELNLSIYFSPNTHLLGEAVALHALGTWFPEWPRSRRWRETGGRITAEEMQRQVRDDGCHFEQSIYYHVYALDFFLLHRVLAGGSAGYDERLQRMAEFLQAVMGPSGMLPLIGDDDGGRLFHPYGDRTQFGRATMATCAALFQRPEWLRTREDLLPQAAWWLDTNGPDLQPTTAARFESRVFRDSGFAVMASGGTHILVKAGGFGEGSGGHSHSDALSLVVRLGDREILIDPGTFTYVADPAERDRFRGSAAHSTIAIDGRDQAVPAGPFRWRDKPAVKIRDWASNAERDSLDATCAYGGFVHRRRILFAKPAALVIVDSVEGAAGEHRVEQFWHAGSPEEERRFSFSAAPERVEAWRSRAFATREPSPALRVTARGTLPVHFAAVVDLSEAPQSRPVTLELREETCVVKWGATAFRVTP
ncbi:MAG TPA: alginate lyase family protein, partial [Verrucomicrobiae bacterium]|nr:alginate lyase family protein [Verrucomicrobiae bacterium]